MALNQVTEVYWQGKQIFLIGTAHVSKESVELVRSVVETVKPEVVAVELCPQRLEALKKGRKFGETQISEIIKQDQTHLFLLQLLLTNFQRKIGEEFGVKPGAEMLEAIKIAEGNGISIALVDRDIKVTLSRAISQMSLKEKAKVAYGFLSSIIEGEEIDPELLEKLKEGDLLSEMMEELAREIPSISKVLVEERNLYIASMIQNLKAEKIVAVLGAGHIEGIKRILESGHRVVFTNLKEVAPKKNRLKYLGYSVPLLFLALIAWGFLRHGGEVTLDLWWKWFIIHGTLSALGATIAWGHPLTILTAFFAAPFTALHPAIAAGWVAGWVELKLRQPRVKDFEGLLKLNRIRDYWHNRVTRVLLVIVLANLGSSIGTFIALPYLASLI